MATPTSRSRRRALATVRRHVRRPRYRPDQRLDLLTSDDVRLTGASIVGPDDAPATIVIVHGFTQSSRTPKLHAFAHHLARQMHVVIPDLRGHGDSEGLCTLGDRETLDVDAAVAWAAAAHPGLPVVTVGISLGGAVSLLNAGGRGGVAGVVAISSPAWWGAWDTPSTRRVQQYAMTRWGRMVAAKLLRTRMADHCPGVPDASELAAAISPAFTLVVADPQDHYFPEVHPRSIYEWAREPKDLWWLPGTGHGTDLIDEELADRLAAYLGERLGLPLQSPSLDPPG